MLADLEALQSSSPKKSILQELDEVAQTIPEVRAKKVAPPKPMQEESFKEMEKKKTLELPLKPEQVKIPLKLMQEETSKETEKKKTPELPLKPEQAKAPPLVENLEVETKERELAKLLKESNQAAAPLTPETQDKKEASPRPIKPKQTATSDLIKELEAMEKKKTFSMNVPLEQEQPEKLNSVPASKDISVPDSKDFNKQPLMSVAEKLKELEKSSEEVRVDISQDRMVLREFKTEIQRGEVPVFERDEAPSLEIDSEHETSNVLSTYVGKVYKRVYSNWKTPLGSKVKKVIVAFTVFRKGNIDQPVIRESAGDENLDSIAVRAVSDSVPFPPLPEELRRPNLRINIVFKYVPEEN